MADGIQFELRKRSKKVQNFWTVYFDTSTGKILDIESGSKPRNDALVVSFDKIKHILSGKNNQNNFKVEFNESIGIRFVYGHTESMMLPQIKYKGRTIVYMADLLPSAGHIPLPYVMAYDTRPLITMEEKAAFLNEAAANDYILFFEHDRTIEACSLHQTEKGIKMKEEIKVKDL